MKRQLKVMVAYLLILVLATLFFDGIGLENDRLFLYTGKSLSLLNPVMFITILGGLIALYLTIPRNLFFLFLVFYALFWLIRLSVYPISEKIGARELVGHIFHFEQILPNYFYSVTRLTTPFPFIIFWMIYSLFINWEKFGPKKSSEK